MNPPHYDSAVVAEAAPAATAPPVAVPQAAAAKLEMLDGDEVIQLSIKPSLWFIPIVSLNLIVAAVLLGVGLGLAMQAGVTSFGALPFQLLAAVVAGRLGFGTLQWASRLYVLTNRRVLRFKGVMNVHVAECRLAKVGAVDVQSAWYSRVLRIGTIEMRSAAADAAPCIWRDVARPQEVHEILVKAIRKAQNNNKST